MVILEDVVKDSDGLEFGRWLQRYHDARLKTGRSTTKTVNAYSVGAFAIGGGGYDRVRSLLL